LFFIAIIYHSFEFIINKELIIPISKISISKYIFDDKKQKIEIDENVHMKNNIMILILSGIMPLSM
tara:strand:+ start:187 stop:384 length:198 start_codon:yes stop_codon:yes gene_type:complete